MCGDVLQRAVEPGMDEARQVTQGPSCPSGQQAIQRGGYPHSVHNDLFHIHVCVCVCVCACVCVCVCQLGAGVETGRDGIKGR